MKTGRSIRTDRRKTEAAEMKFPRSPAGYGFIGESRDTGIREEVNTKAHWQ
jgi:hypothetical protein